MKCTGDTKKHWKIFKDAYTDYAIATELEKKSAKVQAATLKTLMGRDCKKILLNLKLSAEKLNDPKEIIKALDENCV